MGKKDDRDHDYELFKVKLADEINKRVHLARTQPKLDPKLTPKQKKSGSKEN